MTKSKSTVHEPLFHIAKRNGIVWWKAWIVRILAVAAALVVCALVTVAITDLNPIDVYSTMFEGAFGSARRFWNLLQNVAILLCISLAVTPAFKMKFWNLGAEGQVLIGGLATEACMIVIGDKLPVPALIAVMIAASVICGALWAYIPAFFKARWNSNESLFTLMMNYIAIQLVAYFTLAWSVPKGSGQPRTLEYGVLPTIYNQYLLNILIVAVITAVMYVYLKYSKHGYEISVVGGSENTARYIGINVKKVITRTLIVSGAVCGIAGLLIVAGTDHSLKSDTVGGRGFTAIMVSWLAKFNPVFMILTSFLIVFLEKGASQISTAFRLNDAFSDIITGIIIFFIIGSEFFINYCIKFCRKGEKEVTK